MKRRVFITLICHMAAWPLTVSAQQTDRVRRIGVLVGLSENDPGIKPRLAAFREECAKFGWVDGQNIRIDQRYAAGGDRAETLARDLVALEPDVILAHTVLVTAALKRATSTIPIVFVSVGDPIGVGFIGSLARPGGNLTGMMTFEAGIAGKWVQMLKEVAPRLARVMFVADPKFVTYDYYLRAAQGAATALDLELTPGRVERESEIEKLISAFARIPDGALVVPPDLTTANYGQLIVALAAKHRLPAVYAFSYLVASGGLMSYGTDRVAEMRQAASYVDRILRGAAPGDLPVQTPTTFETAVNLKTANILGLTIPATLLARADEVIE
jgi:putative ABC transport system substrate-binding protein